VTPQPQDNSAELARLRALLAARTGKPGYKQNCEAIRQRIAIIENGQLSLISETSQPSA